MSSSEVAVARAPRRALRVEEGYAPAEDGTPLYFRSEGEGPALVLCNGLGVSTFFWQHLVRAFAPTYQVVVWDYRSHGKSGPAPARGFGIATCADDLRHVLDHLGIRSAVLAGHSLGSQVILETYRRTPERVNALVPTLGGYGRTVETFFGTRYSVQGLRALRRLAFLNLALSQQVTRLAARSVLALPMARVTGLVHRDLCAAEDMVPYLANLAMLHLPTYFQLAQDLQDHDASDLLPLIRVPVLIFGGERDLFAPLHVSEHMARTIPGAEICVLRGGSHAALVEQPELLALRLERFLRVRLELPALLNHPTSLS